MARVLVLGATAMGMAAFFIWTRVRIHFPAAREVIAAVSYHPERLGFSPSPLSASTDTFVGVVFRNGHPDTLETIIWSRRLDSTAGSERWHQSFVSASRSGRIITDTVTFDAATLLPITEAVHGPDTTLRLSFVDRAFDMSTVVGDSTVNSVTVPLGINPFSSTQTAAVLAALPLAKGYTAVIPFLVLDTTLLQWKTISVVGVDSICGHESHPDVCWIVDANAPSGRRYQRFSISQQSHQFVALVDRSFTPRIMYSRYYAPPPSRLARIVGTPPAPSTSTRSRFDSARKK